MSRGPFDRLRGVLHELSVASQFRPRSWPRLLTDILAARLLLVVALPRAGAVGTIYLRDGTALSYRLNRGDIQAIQEIWLDEVYRPPPEAFGLDSVIDLGANIGFTSVYLARQLQAPRLVAVEPDPGNAAILRRNLMQNGIEAEVIEAAVGATDGTLNFGRASESNLGRVDPDGDLEVNVLSVASVFRRAGPSTGGRLLKLDIEGGERELFAGDLDWLSEVQCLLAELHPAVVDTEEIVARLETSGLHLHPAENGLPFYWTRRRAVTS